MTESNLPPQNPPSELSKQEPSGSQPEEPVVTGETGTGAGGNSDAGDEDWETVQPSAAISVDSIPQVAEAADSEAAQPRREEMLQLIQDLNYCNDALLARVTQLEEALERSETALQKEVERSQHSQPAADMEVLHSQQQQVAQLLSELDVANDALRRTTIHNETLQSELDASQQRVAQLERECTLLQQRFSDKSTALQQAEITCRDLRSRLQRQQRYTLQFKAALEKCLNMASQDRSEGPAEDYSESTITASEGATHPLAMPKNQRIQPWGAAKGSVPTPSGLDNMLQSLKQTPTASSPPPVQPPLAATEVKDPEAETRLWQDLDRVVESTIKADPPEVVAPKTGPSPATSPPPPTISEAETVPESLGFTEPSPWGAPTPPESAEVPEPASAPQPEPAAYTPAAAGGSGLMMPPTMKAQAPNSPAPVVYPLRPAKKIKSISAVQLPSFPRAKPRPS